MSAKPTGAADPEPQDAPGAAPFADLLCAVDGSRGSRVAVEQAIALTAPGARLRFVAVTQSRGAGLTEMAALGESRAAEALEAAAKQAKEAGVGATADLLKGGSTSDLLLAEVEHHDLLVLGSRGLSRAGGIMLGSTATQAAHRVSRPLLISRTHPEAAAFPQRILLASDGSPGSWAAARATSRVARAFSAAVELVYVPRDVDPERQRTIAEQAVAIREATGVDPEFADASGRVAEEIVEAAGSYRAALVAVGHRGVRGIRALGSVSERVAHNAPCSVLVVPPDD